MPIKWSAVKVDEAMTQVERDLALAEVFIDNAKAKASEALSIANLPEYMEQRLRRLEYEIDRALSIGDSIEAVRNAIPGGATEVERERDRHGNQQSLI